MTIQMDDSWWCGLGFMLKTSNLTDYPTVILMLEVDPKSKRRTEIICAMKDICTQDNQCGWQSYNLSNSTAWTGIFVQKSLQDFLTEKDHVVAVKDFFLKTLDELTKIQRKHSDLPWRVIPEACDSSSAELISSETDILEALKTA